MSHPRTQQNCVSHGSKPDESIQVSSALTRARPFTSWLMLTKVLMFLLLTNASQSGGWVPETSRCFHYWQPAPRWRLLPWLANPCGKRKTGTRHTDKTVDWEGQGETASKESPCSREMLTLRKTLTKTPTNRYNSLRTKNTRNPGVCTYMYLTNRWPHGWNLCSWLLTLLNCI